jgi:SAM-dependent methyltransferase
MAEPSPGPRELPHLATFARAAERGSFTDAAADLGVTQAAVSQRIAALEREHRVSLELIRAVAPAEGGRIIDVGGGASVLVDRLLGHRYEEIADLDISEAALCKAKARLGERADRVRWVVADVTEAPELGTFDIWHDRAVYHFLTDAADRRTYLALAARTVPAGGHVIIGTFALDGPESCSGLSVERYDANTLSAEFGPAFALRRETGETHLTPEGKPQRFFYAVLERVSPLTRSTPGRSGSGSPRAASWSSSTSGATTTGHEEPYRGACISTPGRP